MRASASGGTDHPRLAICQPLTRASSTPATRLIKPVSRKKPSVKDSPATRSKAPKSSGCSRATFCGSARTATALAMSHTDTPSRRAPVMRLRPPSAAVMDEVDAWDELPVELVDVLWAKREEGGPRATGFVSQP